MLKIFTIIFTAYILLLSTVPCCALDNCKDELAQLATNNTHDHDDGCKNCSPFALCGNCVGFVMVAHSIEIITPQRTTVVTFPFFKQAFFSQYSSSFWQPPRLC